MVDGTDVDFRQGTVGRLQDNIGKSEEAEPKRLLETKVRPNIKRLLASNWRL